MRKPLLSFASLLLFTGAGIFTVNYDVVPSTGVIAQAMDFSVGGMTPIWQLSGHTAYTAHFTTLQMFYPQVPATWAAVRLVAGNMGIGAPISGQFLIMYYDQQGQQHIDPVGPVLTQHPQFTVDNIGADVTTQFNSWAGTTTRYLSLQVQGTGKVFQARLEVAYGIP